MSSTITVQVDGSSASTTVNVTAAQQAAQFNAVVYGGSLVAPGGHPLQVMVTGSNYSSSFGGFRAANPGCKLLSYMAPTCSEQTNNGVGSFPYSTTYPENYYLHTSTGARMATSGSGGTLWMNIADPAYQSAVAAHCASSVAGCGSDGVSLDMIMTALFWAKTGGLYPSTPVELPTDAALQVATNNLLAAIKSALPGKLVFANIGGANTTVAGGGPTYWKQYLAHLDGAMEESFAVGSGGTIMNTTSLVNEFGNVQWAEANGKYSLLHTYTNNPTLATYSLGCMLLVAGGLSSLTLTNVYASGADIWQPSFDTALTLGSPSGSYTVNGAVYTRKFQNGTVTVDTNGHTASW